MAAVGRPKEYDRSKIAHALIEWAKLPDSINLCKFCVTYDPFIPPKYITVWAKESEEFSEAYEIAKAQLGARREEMLNSDLIHVKAYDLNAKTYDYFLNEQAQKTAQFESSLKKDEEGAKQSTYYITVPHDLAVGSNIPTQAIPNTSDKGSK